MSENDDFETAVEEVDGAAQSLRKVIEYPLCPKGVHHGKCIKAELKAGEFEGRKYTTLSLTWELDVEYTYKKHDGTEVTQKHRIFDSLGLSYGPKARLPKVFLELTGESHEPLLESKKVKLKGEDYIQEVFQYKAFEEMEADVVVKHVPGKKDPTKLFAKVDSYTCPTEQQKKNAALVFDGTEK